jgi:hypothetical protein
MAGLVFLWNKRDTGGGRKRRERKPMFSRVRDFRNDWRKDPKHLATLAVGAGFVG